MMPSCNTMWKQVAWCVVVVAALACAASVQGFHIGAGIKDVTGPVVEVYVLSR